MPGPVGSDGASHSFIGSLINLTSHCATVVAVTAGLTVYSAGFIGLITSGTTVFGAPATFGLALASQHIRTGGVLYPQLKTLLDYARVTLVGSGVLGATYGFVVGFLTALGIVLDSDRLRAFVGPGDGRSRAPNLLSPKALHAKQLIVGLIALPLGVVSVKSWSGERLVQSVISDGLLQPALCAAVANTAVYLVMQKLFYKGGAGEASGTASGAVEKIGGV